MKQTIGTGSRIELIGWGNSNPAHGPLDKGVSHGCDLPLRT